MDDEPFDAELRRQLEDRFHDVDSAKLAEVLRAVIDACPDRALIERIRTERPGLTVIPHEDGWVYVAAVGFEPDHPTRADVFGRFDRGLLMKPLPQG